MRWRFGSADSQCSIGQSPTVLRQPPQRHARRWPTRMTSDVQYDVESCATPWVTMAAITPKNARNNLRLNLLVLNRGGRAASNAYYLRARILQAHLAGNQANQSAKK